MVFHWSDNKFPQVSRTLLSILADLSNVVWTVSTQLLVSKSSSPFTNPLVIVPRAPITIGITVTFMFNCFSILSQDPGTYPSLRFLSILHCGQPGHQSPQFCKFFFFFWLIIIRSGCLIIIIIIVVLLLARVSQQCYLVVFHMRLTESMSLLRSPELFSVSLLSLKVLWSGWFLFFF